MDCSEITAAISWARQTTPNVADYPVTAFFTRHAGALSKPADPPDGARDLCRYAVGHVQYVAPQAPIGVVGHLAGDLIEYWNGGASNSDDEMGPRKDGTVGVQIFPDGTVIFQEKLNNKPIGGPAPTTVVTTCVGGVLLSGTNGNEVVVLGVRREPSLSTRPPG